MGAHTVSPQVKIKLDCGHITLYRVPTPEIGSKANCQTCNNWRTVIDIPDYWEMRCITRKGHAHKLARTEGAARRYANTHIRHYPHHRLQIRHDGLCVSEWSQTDGWYEPWHPSLPAAARATSETAFKAPSVHAEPRSSLGDTTI